MWGWAQALPLNCSESSSLSFWSCLDLRGSDGKSRVKAITTTAEFNKAVKAAGNKVCALPTAPLRELLFFARCWGVAV